jgi:hypothetical protein
MFIGILLSIERPHLTNRRETISLLILCIVGRIKLAFIPDVYQAVIAG